MPGKQSVATTTTAADGLNIVELRACNFGALKAVQIRPDGSGLVQITGRNDQGKSTVLRAVVAAMKGRGTVMRALRDGTEEGFLQADCGRLKVLRTITRARDGGETWTLVVTLDGKRQSKRPQDVIDGFLGALSFDPLAFAKAKPGDQVDQLKRLVPGVDFDAMETARADLFRRRTDVGRDRDREKAAAEAIALPPGGKPAAVDMKAKMAEFSAGNSHNLAVAERYQRRTVVAKEIEDKLDKAEALRAQAATIEIEAAELQKKLDAAPPLPDLVDVKALAAEIESADAANKARALHLMREGHETAYDTYKTEYDRMTDELAGMEAAKRAAIATAKLPVDGLDFDDQGVNYHDRPLHLAALSQKIRISTAIAMALNPELRVVLIDEGSELDSETLAAVAEMARERGFDVWVTRVDESGKVGFVIEAGEVVETGEVVEP